MKTPFVLCSAELCYKTREDTATYQCVAAGEKSTGQCHGIGRGGVLLAGFLSSAACAVAKPRRRTAFFSEIKNAEAEQQAKTR